jgi:hypothetical protein
VFEEPRQQVREAGIGNLMSQSFDEPEACTGNSVGQGQSMFNWKYGIRCSVDHECGHGDLAEAVEA